MHQAHGLCIPETLTDACDPRRLALIVYDVQVGIVRQLKKPEETLQQVLTVLDTARKHGVRVVFMRHMSLPNEFAGVYQTRQAMRWQRAATPSEVRPWFLRGSEAWKLVPELAPRPEEPIFDKITMSAFEGTPLAFALRDCDVNAFAIVGAATEIGIKPTVRHGGDLGFLPIVIQDACAAGDEEAGARAIDVLRFHGDAFLTTSAEFASSLADRR